jgi:hypothetical protein
LRFRDADDRIVTIWEQLCFPVSVILYVATVLYKHQRCALANAEECVDSLTVVECAATASSFCCSRATP